MANHVSSYISFENLSEEAEEYLVNVFGGGADVETSLYCLFGMPEGTEYNWDWWSENIGSKWLTLEDVGSDYMAIMTAWSPPIPFYNKLYEVLSSLSPDLFMWVRYDDEMPNFIGCCGYGPNDYSYEESVDAEYYENAIGTTPYIDDESNDDWWDELDKWYDSEYKCFMEGYSEHMEYIEDERKTH